MELVLSSNRFFLILIAALGYAVATILMKITAQSGSVLIFIIIVTILGITALTEVFLLRELDLGIAYIAILATETILVIGFAQLMGEGMSGREMAGGALVVAGAFLING
jgi:multidrug transporter EmrE-like cation transporter